MFLLLPIVLFSCQRTPEASFSVDSNAPEVGKAVYFNNHSHDGEKYEWDFGDGYTSNEREPAHTFSATGSYEVTLTAIAKGGRSSTSSLTLDVVSPSLLVIEVQEYYSGDLIPNASIILYPSLADWDAQTNSIIEGFTDKNGLAVFADLDPAVYYVDVWEATHDNWTLRKEDEGFVMTPVTLAHVVTFFRAAVDVANHTSAMRGDHGIVIKSLGRKAVSMKPAIYTGTETLQELYNRSVKRHVK